MSGSLETMETNGLPHRGTDEARPTHARPSPRMRRLVIGLTGVLLAGAVYLFAVRGDAILADLAAVGSRVWCF